MTSPARWSAGDHWKFSRISAILPPHFGHHLADHPRRLVANKNKTPIGTPLKLSLTSDTTVLFAAGCQFRRPTYKSLVKSTTCCQIQMSATLIDHASMSDVARADTRQHGALSAAIKTKEPAICPTDQETVTPKRNTQSLDYVWRSGVAGGMAGCAVSLILRYKRGCDEPLMICVGQDPRCAPRPSKDFVSGKKSRLREI